MKARILIRDHPKQMVKEQINKNVSDKSQPSSLVSQFHIEALEK